MALFSGKKNEAGAGESPIAAPPETTAETTAKTRPSDAGVVSQPRPTQQGELTVANIGKSIAIKGDLTGNEDMVIEGNVEGSIDLPNNQLTIGADGVVKAEVHAKSVIVVGLVEGNIHGIERVEIQGTGRVEGNVTAPKFVVAEGAQLDGSIQMAGAESAASGSKSQQAAGTGSAAAAANEPTAEVRKTA